MTHKPPHVLLVMQLRGGLDDECLVPAHFQAHVSGKMGDPRYPQLKYGLWIIIDHGFPSFSPFKCGQELGVYPIIQEVPAPAVRLSKPERTKQRLIVR